MLGSLEIQAHKYPSFGHCIFCGRTDSLTDEHIVPETLSGIGELLIKQGSCRACNNYANEAYEQRALQNDFLPVRHLLELKRKRRGKRTAPRKMPPVAYTAEMETAATQFNYEVPVESYPPLFEFMQPPPAGLLVGEDRSAGLTNISVGYLHLALKNKRGLVPHQVTMRHPHVMGAPEMTIAKMAYCYTVAEKGFGFAHLCDLRDLLSGRRNDVFNFGLVRFWT